MRKSVAIVGGAIATAEFAPFNDKNWDIWGMAWHTQALQRTDLLFDIHHPGFKGEGTYRLHYNSHHNRTYVDKVNASGVPIICDPLALATFTNGIPYPLDEVKAIFPRRDFLECTVSYMIAYAIWKGYERIGLWGCHFTGKDEYQYQLPSVTWLLGYAEAHEIEVYICPGGPLMASGYNAGRYGVDHGTRPRTAGPTDWRKVTMSIEVNGRPVRFCVPNERAVFRVETIHTKEPKTVEWIRKMPPNSTFWDIGANIGIYSAYAAAYGHNVVAVEAHDGYVGALAQTAALSDLDNIRVTHATLNEHDTIDALVQKHGYPPPTHIKIDTDGDDLLVVKGARETLAGVQSVIVETDERRMDDKAEIDEILTVAGLVKTGRHFSSVGPNSVGMDHWHR
jgi:hypothetical protein